MKTILSVYSVHSFNVHYLNFSAREPFSNETRVKRIWDIMLYVNIFQTPSFNTKYRIFEQRQLHEH